MAHLEPSGSMLNDIRLTRGQKVQADITKKAKAPACVLDQGAMLVGQSC